MIHSRIVWYTTTKLSNNAIKQNLFRSCLFFSSNCIHGFHNFKTIASARMFLPIRSFKEDNNISGPMPTSIFCSPLSFPSLSASTTCTQNPITISIKASQNKKISHSQSPRVFSIYIPIPTLWNLTQHNSQSKASI